MSDKQYVVFAASYAAKADAQADLSAIKQSGAFDDVTAAIVSRDAKGKLHVNETTHAGKVAAGVGVVAGAIIGAIFPPAGIAVVAAAAGGAAGLGVIGGAIGHFAGGINRKDMKELGDYLDIGEATLIAVAVDKVATEVDTALTRATNKASRAVNKGDVADAIADLENGLDKAINIAGE